MGDDAQFAEAQAAAESDAAEAEAQADAFGSTDVGGTDEFPADAEDAFGGSDEDGGQVSSDEVVGALISALVSGNSGDAQNALAFAAAAGYDVSGAGSVPIQGKKDLPALEAEAIAAADDDPDE